MLTTLEIALVSVESDVFQCPCEDGDCVFKQMDVVIETADVQGVVVGQVDVGPQDTVSGHVAVDPVDGVRVEVLP